MQFNFKNYQFSKTKQYFVKNNFFFLTIGTNQSAQKWLSVEQNLYKLKLDYHKIYNNTAIKLMKESTYKNSTGIISSTFFFIRPKNSQLKLNKSKIFKELNLIKFTLLAIKLNNKIYTKSQTLNVKSFSYRNNMSLMYQFLLTNLKFSYTITKK
jgi:hypothetical protein